MHCKSLSLPDVLHEARFFHLHFADAYATSKPGLWLIEQRDLNMAIVIDRAKGFEAMSIYIPLLAVDRVHVTLQSAAARKTMWFYVTGLHWAPEISIKGLFTKLCHLQKTATGWLSGLGGCTSRISRPEKNRAWEESLDRDPWFVRIQIQNRYLLGLFLGGFVLFLGGQLFLNKETMKRTMTETKTQWVQRKRQRK